MTKSVTANKENKKGLLNELKQLVKASKAGDFNIIIDDSQLSGKEAETAHLIKKIISNYKVTTIDLINELISSYKAAAEYNIMKYKLANDALGVALWDVDTISGDPYDPYNKFTWSQEFRHMLGFSDENDFPNTLYSWSDRIHPEDKEKVFNSLMAHLDDYTGKTPFNVKYRIMMKNGEYRHFHAFGTSLRNSVGAPCKVAGAVLDITEEKKTADVLKDALSESSRTLEIMTNILNNSSSMIYVTDPETSEILFINDHMKQHYGIEVNIGDICYKVLQAGLNERCDFCPCHQLDKEPDKVVVWEEHSTLTKRFYQNSDRYVDWPGGKKVHIQHSFDITDIKKTHDELESKQRMLYAVNSAANLLLNPEVKTFENALRQSMKIITETVNVDRMYIWKNHRIGDKLYCNQIYEWSENVEPQQDKIFTLGVSYSEYAPRWEKNLSKGKCINNLVRNMPIKEQELLLPQGIVSILVLPVFIKGQFWGFVGFDDCRNERVFTKGEESILNAASLLFANAVIRNEMQHKISEEYEFNQVLFESLPLGLVVFNDKYECLNCSDKVLNMLQTNEKYFIEHMDEFSPKHQPCGQKSSDKAKALMDMALSGKAMVSEWIHISASGELIPCEVTLARAKRGKRYVVLVYTYDLRNIKSIEAEAEEANKRVRIMLDSNPIICILRDKDNNILDCNQEALRIFGVSTKADLINNAHKIYPEFQPDGSNSIKKAKMIFENLLKTRTSDSVEWTFQNIKGEPIPVETKVVPIRWEGGNRFLSYSRDLREIKAKELELSEAAERERKACLQKEAALAANDAKNQFLAHMSHEIRTPMNAILGMAELMMQESLSTRQLQYTEDIKIAAMALLDIINDILDLSKLQAGKLSLLPVHYDFKEMIHNVKSIANFLAKNKNITFRLNMQKNMPAFLYGDDVRLRQVFLNLISNAVKFTEAGYVRLSVNYTGTNIKITISDTGIGIPAEKLTKIFEPFEQADSYKNRKTTGTGLGLTITKAIIEMMGGQISLESEYGQGTSVHFEIPKILGDKTLIQHTDSKEAGRLYAPGAKILVVDDNQMNLNVASGLLQLYHITVDTAKSGKQAIEMVQRNQYDIVFMDHMMPGMTGIEATKIMRKSGITIPIIALTASAMAGSKEMMIEAGMDDYLSKPIIKFELQQMLKKWIPAEKLLDIPPEMNTTHLDEKHEEFWNKIKRIEELSISIGLDRIDGQQSLYEKMLKLAIQENIKSIKNLSDFLSVNDMENFRIEVHALKSTLANIGAMELSAKALELEIASKKMYTDFCSKNLPPFLEQINDLTLKLKEAFSIINQSNIPTVIPPELPLIFQRITEAFNEIDLISIDQEVENLNALNLSGALKEEVEQIKDMVMMMDYDGAAEHIQKLLTEV